MSFERNGDSIPSRLAVSRRQLLAATVGAAAGVAGCTGEESDPLEFEAEPVGLDESAREELILAQTAGESSTTEREVEGLDGEATITSYLTAFERGRAMGQPTLIEKFMGQVNGTEGAGSAAVVPKREFDTGNGRIRFDYVDWIHDDAPFSLVVPGGVRSGDAASQPIPDSVMVLAGLPPSAEIPWPSADYIVDLAYFMPPQVWMPEDPGVWMREDPGVWMPEDPGVWMREERQQLVKQWIPGSGPALWDWLTPEDFPESKVLVSLGNRTPEEVFGVPAEEMPGERVEDGESFGGSTNPFLVAAPGSQFVTGTQTLDPEQLFEAGVPAPTPGATYGLGALSTPAVEVGGQARNPLAEMSLEELLTNDQFSDLLPKAGVPVADNRWFSGPTPVADAPTDIVHSKSAGETTILDQETELETFVGVLSGEHGPWWVAVDLARVRHEHDDGTDVVVGVGAHYSPAAESDEGGFIESRLDNRWFDERRFTGILGSILSEARTLTGESGKRFYTGADELIDSA